MAWTDMGNTRATVYWHSNGSRIISAWRKISQRQEEMENMTFLNSLANLVPSFPILYCPQPLGASMLLYVRPHVSDIPECLSFYVWLISLNIVTSSFINVSTNGKCLSFMWAKCSTVFVCLLFIRRKKLQAWHTVTQKGDQSSQHSTVVQHR